MPASSLGQRVALSEAHQPTDHSAVCCLIYATQNGWKLPILFEEMGVAYDWALVDFERREQHTESFLAINPNGRIPALIDREHGVTVAESGAILEYAARRYQSSLLPSWETEREAHVRVKQWLYWQVSGLGPAMGQAMYFQRIARVQGRDAPFAIRRFVRESKRCLGMLDRQLEGSGGPFVLGKRCTLVDVACFPYCASAFWAGVDISDLSHLQAWIDRLHQRPSFARGLTIPFARPAFFGPLHASQSEIDAAIDRNARQFEVATDEPGIDPTTGG